MTISLFSGQGSQYPGMGKDILEAYPNTGELYDIASDILGRDMRKVCFESAPEELAQTINAQPAVLLTSLVCFSAAISRIQKDGTPFSYDGVAGHSLGEYAAMAVSGVVSKEDVFRLIGFHHLWNKLSAGRLKLSRRFGFPQIAVKYVFYHVGI